VSATADVARMLTLVPWLLERPGASLAETAEAFGVDPATIADDLYHLDFCGLPGLGGGALFDVSQVGDRIVLTMADELQRPLRPSAADALRLVLSVDAVAEVLGEELPALRSAVDKVRRALGVPDGAAAVIEPSPTQLVATARAAIGGGRRVELRYQGRGDAEPQRRRVDPWAVHVEDGEWYLQGHDLGADDRRVFRLDRALDLTVLDEPVEHPAPDQLPSPRYVPGPDDLQVTIEVDPAGRWLADALVVDELTERGGGGAVLRLRTDAPTWVERLVCMAGGAARVTDPPEMAASVRERARRALAAYGSP
jgi:proteasome accessory factor C